MTNTAENDGESQTRSQNEIALEMIREAMEETLQYTPVCNGQHDQSPHPPTVMEQGEHVETTYHCPRCGTMVSGVTLADPPSKRRAELREELSAPDWFPEELALYYNIATWRGRLAFAISTLEVKVGTAWYRNNITRRLSSWANKQDTEPRWRKHDDY